MDKGPNGATEKYLARKNNDLMIKVLIIGHTNHGLMSSGCSLVVTSIRINPPLGVNQKPEQDYA